MTTYITVIKDRNFPKYINTRIPDFLIFLVQFQVTLSESWNLTRYCCDTYCKCPKLQNLFKI